MPVYSAYTKQNLVFHFTQGHKGPRIQQLLLEVVDHVTRITAFLKRYLNTGSIARRPGSGQPSKATEDVKELIEQMCLDDESTASELHDLVSSKGHGLQFCGA